jgi:hypothetical protein
MPTDIRPVEFAIHFQSFECVGAETGVELYACKASVCLFGSRRMT